MIDNIKRGGNKGFKATKERGNNVKFGSF